MQATQEHKFEKGINIDRPRKFSPEFGFAGFFYLCVLVHVVICIVIFASKNTAPITLENEGGVVKHSCPDGMVPSSECASSKGVSIGWASHSYCVTSDLCDDLVTCARANKRRLATLTKEDVPDDVWGFMEKHFYQPITLFSCVFIAAAIWMVALQRAPKAVVWASIGADIVLLIAIFVWFLIEEEQINWACIVIVALMVVGCGLLFKKINMAAVMMKYAMDGLFANPRIFAVCFGVQLLWVCFFALWVAALISAHFVKQAEYDNDSMKCELQSTAWSNGGMMIWMALHYLWVTYFLRNVNVYVITSNVAGWYFKEEGYKSFWVKGAQWAFGPLAGGNAIASAVMGLLEYLLSKVGSTWRLIFACLNPLEWIFLCLGLCLKTVAQTFTKYGVIAQAYSGRGFCENAPKALSLLKDWLGEAMVCDYVGKRVLSWMTYALSLGVAFAAWAWADQVQGVSSFGKLPAAALFFVTLAFAWILSHPFLGLLFVIFFEMILGNAFSVCKSSDQGCLEVRAVFNGIFSAMFMGCITFFILTFLSQVVVTAMDVCLFCYAVESDLGLRDADPGRKEFYDAVKETVVEGNVNGMSGVVEGAPVGAAPAPTMMTVQAPEGAQAGTQLKVQAPSGQEVQVTVPEGVAPGQSFQVQLPEKAPAQAEVVTVVGARTKAPTNVKRSQVAPEPPL